MNDAVYQMLWDCKFCGQKKLLGLTHRFCAGCGAPQDPNARYFPSDADKVAVQDHVYVGADVTCPACKQPMSRAAKCCTNCGGPIDRGAQVALREPPQAWGPGAATPPHVAPFGGRPYPGAPPPFGGPVKKGLPAGAIIAMVAGGVFLLVVLLIVVAAFWKREGSFEVVGHEWQRTIAVERYENVQKTAWCDGVPVGGREIARHREQRSTRKIPDGKTCSKRKKDNGDGTYREIEECTTKYREEPVMDWKCDFEITEWRVARTLLEKGTSPSDPPKWPVATLRTGTCLGCEREGARNETYTVRFREPKENKDASCSLPQAKWQSFTKGSQYTGEVGVLTGIVECDGLKRK